MLLIAIKINNPNIDITTKEGYHWLQNNLMNDKVIFYNSDKGYSSDPAMDIFRLIQKGAVITKGELYGFFEKLIKVQ